MSARNGHASSSGGDAQGGFDDGRRLAGGGQLDQAEASFHRAAEAGHPTAAAYAGLFSESRGELEQAEELYRRADEGEDGYGAFRLGMLLSRRNDWDGAAKAWRRAQQRGYDSPDFERPLLDPSADTAAVPNATQRAAFANPVLLGAITTLVLLIAVFLAYNANSGLPFVPTRQLKVDIPNGAALLPGNQVLAGGYDVGMVSAMRPVRMPNGTVGAQVTLQLNTANGKVPVDSTATIAPRSLLGLKYVQLTYGHSKQIIPDGGTLPAKQTSVPVQFDDINKLFDKRTRPAVQKNLVGFGDTLASRGSSLNDTFAALPALLGHLEPVARYLSDPSTQLTRFFQSLNGFFGTLSPVAQTQVRLFADQATTFAAIIRSPSDYEHTIQQSPPTLDVSTTSLIKQQPFLVDLTHFSNAMRPATASLRGALPQLDPALEAGIRVLPRTPSMNVKLQGVLRALKSLALAPGTNMALNGLTQTVGILNPFLRYEGPFVTVCNNWNYFWTELADVVSEGTTFGNAQRTLLNFANHQTNSVGSQGATAPANGYLNTPQDQAAKLTTGGADAEYLHAPNYGAAVDNQGNADCEAGQRGYPLMLNHLDPKNRRFNLDAHTPGSQGMNWTGRLHVPAGETFTRQPSGGPQLPNVPGNN